MEGFKGKAYGAPPKALKNKGRAPCFLMERKRKGGTRRFCAAEQSGAEQNAPKKILFLKGTLF